ncbi:TerB family tellurite resistance protein [Pseudocnuella soli]|uniref:TerB family tellurite resistance protein n=1 Tax=Pseudocnuella soli TaxID=2502779 RepID=UPI00104818DB|nr:TerB family tellurite resistance protein [Pseudocnuella soli]
MDQQTTILAGASDGEKAAYLGVIASIATADHEASDEELEYIAALCESADLPQAQTEEVLRTAREASEPHLKQHLETLKTSDLKFSLVTDLITFAKADQHYSKAEQHHVQRIAEALQIDQQQFGLLDEYTEKAIQSDAAPEEVASPTFLANTGLQQKMQSAGINTGGLLKGLLSFAGPMILAAMLRRRGGGGGLGGMLGGGGLGGALGGMLGGSGGLGGMLGGGNRSGGGLGSLIGMLSGGRGMSGAGGMLGRMLGGRF